MGGEFATPNDMAVCALSYLLSLRVNTCIYVIKTCITHADLIMLLIFLQSTHNKHKNIYLKINANIHQITYILYKLIHTHICIVYTDHYTRHILSPAAAGQGRSPCTRTI